MFIFSNKLEMLTCFAERKYQDSLVKIVFRNMRAKKMKNVFIKN